MNMFSFGNSNADTIECTTKLARYVVRRPSIITFWHHRLCSGQERRQKFNCQCKGSGHILTDGGYHRALGHLTKTLSVIVVDE
jgi:hypothetical protein